MAKTVRSPAETILGEAVYGTREERFRDMLAIASIISNRAALTGRTPEDIVSAPGEFSSYGKSLPPGASAYRDLAQKAWNQVITIGPVHSATYYATPSAAKNLPTGLKQVTATTGHVYYEDPKARPIGTAKGYVKPTIQAVQKVAASAGGLLAKAADTVGGLLPDIAPAPSSRPSPAAKREVHSGLGPITYDNHGLRSLVPSSGIVEKVARAANEVIPGVRTSLYAGQEPTGGRHAGTPHRHPLGFAGDFDFYDPKTGKKVTNPVALHDIAMAMAAQHNANVGYSAAPRGTKGAYMGPGRIHLDTMPLDQFPGAAEWGATAKGPWASNLNFARATGIGPTPYTNAPTPYSPTSTKAQALARPDNFAYAGPKGLAETKVSPETFSAKVGQVTRGGPLASAKSREASIRQMAARSMLVSGVTRIGGTVAGPAKAALAPSKPNTFEKMVTGMASPVYGPNQVSPAGKPAVAKAAAAQPSVVDLAKAYSQLGSGLKAAGVGNLAGRPANQPAPPATYVRPEVAAPVQPAKATPVAAARPAPVARPTIAPVATTAKAPAATIAPRPAATAQFPAAPPTPKQGILGQLELDKRAQWAAVGALVGGVPGALAAGLLGPSLQNIARDALGGRQARLDRFSTGSGLAGIMGALNGPRGATGYSRSNPGMSVTSLGNGMTERRSGKYGWTETVGPDGSVVGIRYDDPNKGIRGMLGSLLGGGRGSLSPAADAAIGRGMGGLY